MAGLGTDQTVWVRANDFWCWAVWVDPNHFDSFLFDNLCIKSYF